MLLIAGNGRNTGKTQLACEVIHSLAQQHKVTAIKISPHFHDFDPKQLVVQHDDFIILNETAINTKDSSRMLQAGANKVFFVMVRQDKVKEAFDYLLPHLSDHPVVCESGGLHEIVTPGLFIFVKRHNTEIIKKQHLAWSPLIVNNFGDRFDLEIDRIEYSDGGIYLDRSEV